MSEQHHSQSQQRRQAVRRYRHALERGDPAVIAAVLGEAEDDPILESMLLKMDRLSQAQEGITVSADQLLRAYSFLQILREETHVSANDEVLGSGKDPLQSVTGKNGTTREGKPGHPVQKELFSMPLNAGANRKAAPHLTRLPRAAHFLQAAAAILVVGALIAGFLLVFSLRSGALHQTTQTGAPPGSPPGIYMSRSDGVYRLNIQTRKIIWHTHVAGQSLFAGDPVIIGNTLYIITDGPVSALDAQTGTLRWSHDFHGRVADPYFDKGLLYFSTIPPLPIALYAVNPANGTITATYRPIQGQPSWAAPTVAGDFLYYVANSTLYAVQLPREKLVWQQQLSKQVLFIAPRGIVVQNGIVYVQILQESPSRNGLLEAFNARTGSKLWQSPALAGGLRIAAVTNEMLYAASFGGELLAFNSHTHALIWQKSFNTYAIQAASGRLYIEYGSDIGQLAALSATTGNLLWQQSKSNGLGLDGIFNGVVYGESWRSDGNGGTIYAFNASNGTQLWTMPTGVPNMQWGGIVVA